MQETAFSSHNLLINKPIASAPPENVTVIQLYDRRSAKWEMVHWVLQADMERVMFSNKETTGAVYRLLNRSPGYGDTLRGSLSLRHSSIDSGLITTSEWEHLKSLAHKNVRVMTIVPVESARAAILTHGNSEVNAWLLEALRALPTEWVDGGDASVGETAGAEEGEGSDAGVEEGGDEGEEEDREEEDEEEDTEEDDEEDGEEDDTGDGDRDGEGDREGDGDGDREGDGEESEQESNEYGLDPDDVPETEVEDNDDDSVEDTAEHTLSTATLLMEPQLVRDIEAFGRYREAPLNVHRGGVAVASHTTESDKAVLVQFFSWMQQRGGNQSFGCVFSSDTIGVSVQAYLNECRSRSVKWATCARRVASCLSAAKFVHAVRQTKASAGNPIPTTAIDQLARLHTQCKRSATQESKFTLAKKPAQWLCWEDVQRARVKAQRALSEYRGTDTAKHMRLTRDVCLLTLLSMQPPDRFARTQPQTQVRELTHTPEHTVGSV